MSNGPSLPKGLPYECAGCDTEMETSREIHYIDDCCRVYCERCAPRARQNRLQPTN